MKLIIDIPDKDYEFIKDLQTLVIGSRWSCKTIQHNLINAIKNGIPYEERPHGEWINITEDTASYKKWICSICGRMIEIPYTDLDPDVFVPFCHCGADMRGDKE